MDRTMNINIDASIGPARIVIGLILYIIGLYAVWPPTLWKAITIAICCALFIALYGQVDIKW